MKKFSQKIVLVVTILVLACQGFAYADDQRPDPKLKMNTNYEQPVRDNTLKMT